MSILQCFDIGGLADPPGARQAHQSPKGAPLKYKPTNLSPDPNPSEYVLFYGWDACFALCTGLPFAESWAIPAKV